MKMCCLDKATWQANDTMLDKRLARHCQSMSHNVVMHPKLATSTNDKTNIKQTKKNNRKQSKRTSSRAPFCNKTHATNA
jgi:hypothetical protein